MAQDVPLQIINSGLEKLKMKVIVFLFAVSVNNKSVDFSISSDKK